MKKSGDKQDATPAEVKRDILSWEAGPKNPASEQMPERFWHWLVAEFESEVQLARTKLDEAVTWRIEAARLCKDARASRSAAARSEGGIIGPKTLEAQSAAIGAARVLAGARDVEQLRRSKVKECENRLKRARAGVKQAQDVVVESWSKNYSSWVMGPLSPLPVMPSVEEVQAARDKPGVSLTTRGRLAGAVNRWLVGMGV